MVGTWWYWVSMGRYRLVLLGIKWYWVSIGLLCLYVFILKQVEIWSDVTIAGQQKTKERILKDRATQPIGPLH